MKYLVVDARIANNGSVVYGKRPWVIAAKDPMSIGGLYFVTVGQNGRVKLCYVIREITDPL